MSKKPSILSVKLFPEQDDDIIGWLRSLGKREKSAHVRLALRQFIQCANYNQVAVKSQPLPNVNKETTSEFDEESTEPDTKIFDLEAKIDKW